MLYLIFHRLNTGSVPLSPQELRQALHPGPFLKFAVKYSESSEALRKVLGLTRPDFRMRDVELLVRYFAFRNRIELYTGNLKQFLDDACKNLNKDWKLDGQRLEAQAVDFEAAVSGVFSIFGEADAFKKWDGKSYERRFNRAVFDVMTYYFSDGTVRGKAIQSRQRVKSSFEQLCDKDTEFRRSIETTTKSKEATSARLRLWGEVLKKIVGTVQIPKLTTK